MEKEKWSFKRVYDIPPPKTFGTKPFRERYPELYDQLISLVGSGIFLEVIPPEDLLNRTGLIRKQLNNLGYFLRQRKSSWFIGKKQYTEGENGMEENRISNFPI